MVPCVLVRLLVSLLLPFGAIAKLAVGEGSSCTSSQGWDGICMLSYECSGLGELVVKGYTPELCNTAGPVVCCPLDSERMPEIRPDVYMSTSRPINISPSPTPYVAEESQSIMRKVTLPTMRIRRKRPSVKRHAHILLKTYDDEVNSILIRTHRLKPTWRKKRPTSMFHMRTPSYAISRAHVKNHFTEPQPSLAAQIAEAKFEADQEAALLLADMSGAHSVSISTSTTPPTSTPAPIATTPSVSTATPRISQIMCDTYSEAMMETIAELSKKGVVPKKTEKCTLTSMMANLKTTSALVGEFPHVVGLGYPDPSLRTVWGKCSGSLISEEFVLTAAHCTHAPAGRPISVGLGSKTLSADTEVTIREVIVHPQYNKTTYANDLALVRLMKKVRLSDTLRPACLPKSPVIPRSLVGSHWSIMPTAPLEMKTKSNETHLFSSSNVMGLQKEKMALVKNKECHINEEFTESFLCAQSTVHRRSVSEECQGYGGDALQMRNSDNKCMYTLVGIAVENVCDDMSPIAFTKVSHYLHWIETVVWG